MFTANKLLYSYELGLHDEENIKVNKSEDLCGFPFSYFVISIWESVKREHTKSSRTTGVNAEVKKIHQATHAACCLTCD